MTDHKHEPHTHWVNGVPMSCEENQRLTDQTRGQEAAKDYDGPYKIVKREGRLDVVGPDGLIVLWCYDLASATSNCGRLNAAYASGLAAGRAGVAEWLRERAAEYSGRKYDSAHFVTDGVAAIRHVAERWLREHPAEGVKK